MSSMSDRGGSSARTFAFLAFGMILFGSATPVSKIVTESMPVFIASGLRVLLGALALLPFVWGRFGTIRDLPRADWWKVGGIALFGMLGFSAFMLIGMKMISGVEGAIVMSVTPAVTAGAAVLFLGENVTWRRVTALGLAVAGVAILQMSGGSGSEGGSGGPAFSAEDPLTGLLTGLGTATWLGIAFIFAAVCCEAAYTLLGRSVARDIDPVVVAFLAAAASLPLFIVPAAIQWPSLDLGAVDLRAWLALGWYGVGTLALGTALWYRGAAAAEGSVAAGFMGLMPVSALVLSYVLLGEPFAWMHLVGFAVVFAGVLLISWEHARMGNED
jgi:drug/metabolite transporter (DMT)-like permease